MDDDVEAFRARFKAALDEQDRKEFEKWEKRQERINATEIDITRLNEVTFTVLVMWLRGMKVLTIAKLLWILEGRVQHPIRTVDKGGYLPKARKDMTDEERQRHLNRLKANRLDKGRLPDEMFVVGKINKRQYLYQ